MSLSKPNVNKRENKVTLCLYSSRLCYLVQRENTSCINVVYDVHKKFRDAECRFRFQILFFTKFRMHRRLKRKWKMLFMRALIAKVSFGIFLALTLVAILSLVPAKTRFTFLVACFSLAGSVFIIINQFQISVEIDINTPPFQWNEARSKWNIFSEI